MAEHETRGTRVSQGETGQNCFQQPAVSPRHFLDFGIQFGPKFEPQANQLVNVSKHTVRSTDDDDDDDDDDDEDNNNSNYYYFF